MATQRLRELFTSEPVLVEMKFVQDVDSPAHRAIFFGACPAFQGLTRMSRMYAKISLALTILRQRLRFWKRCPICERSFLRPIVTSYVALEPMLYLHLPDAQASISGEDLYLSQTSCPVEKLLQRGIPLLH